MRAVDPAAPPTMEPRSGDVTVELTRDFLLEHSSDLLDIIEGSSDGLARVSGLWEGLQDETPTAKVHYLGEDDPDSYDLEDLLDPPTPQAIQNLLLHGRERVEEVEEVFFKDLEAFEFLAESSSVATLEAPSTDAIADRTRMARNVIERSRAVAALATPVLPPSPGARPSTAVAAPSEPEPAMVVDVVAPAAKVTAPSAVAPQGRRFSSWVAYTTAIGLGATATWAAATGVAAPVIVALFVGAAAIIALAAPR